MRTPEFDAFGPWVLEVLASDDVPPLFADHPMDLRRASLVLKVPRPLARREAHPGMDLYDHLLVVDDQALTVLSRRVRAGQDGQDGRGGPDLRGGYETFTVPHGSVVAIEHGTDLLDGRLVIHARPGPRTPSAPVRVAYSGTSEPLVTRLVDVLRAATHARLAEVEALTGAPAMPDLAPLGLRDLGDQDVELVTAQLALLRHEPDARLVGFHRRSVAEPSGSGWVPRLRRRLRPEVVHAAVVCANAREVQVLSRRWPVTRRNVPAHSVVRTVLVVANVDAVTARDHPRVRGLRVLGLWSGAALVEVTLPDGSGSERALSGRLRTQAARAS